jgi:hypothetical protein
VWASPILALIAWFGYVPDISNDFFRPKRITVDSTPTKRDADKAPDVRGHAPVGNPDRRDWYTPTIREFDTTPEVTSYAARR